MTELKPCPFCGGEATYWLNNTGGISVGCLTNYRDIDHPRCPAEPIVTKFRRSVETAKEEAIKAWNTRPNPWHTGTPTIDDPFLIKEVFILLFIHPSGEIWNYHAHLFKPDFTQKCFYSWCDKRIKFSFNTEGLLWQKIEPYK